MGYGLWLMGSKHVFKEEGETYRIMHSHEKAWERGIAHRPLPIAHRLLFIPTHFR